METPPLTPEQFDILDHTVNRAAGGRFCGGGREMQELVTRGLMRSLGQPAWTGDEYFGITAAGHEALRTAKAALPKPPAPKKPTRGQLRYQRFLEFRDDFTSFIDFCRWDALHHNAWD